MKDTKLTKIVATIGPVSDSAAMIKNMILAGVNVFRFNMKHATVEWHRDRIKLVKEVAQELEVPVGILVDLQGPELRMKTWNNVPFKVYKGEQIKVVYKMQEDRGAQIALPRKAFFEAMDVGDSFMIDDGFLEFKVTDLVNDRELIAQSMDDYDVYSNKGVNVVGKDLPIKSITRDDLDRLDGVSKLGVDFVALSFCRTKEDIHALRRAMDVRGMEKTAIVAKLESKKALDNLEELVAEADVIMVARGDLGTETPMEQLAYWQKTIITLCRQYRKSVITATQMLDSMQRNPKPTRAESTDVANAVFDGTDAVMLSGETAGGKYPLKAVETMAAIVKYNEKKATPILVNPHTRTITESVVDAGVKILDEQLPPKIDAVVVFTETGSTARAISAHRTNIPIIAVSDRMETCNRLTMAYGITPFFTKFPAGAFVKAEQVLKQLLKEKMLFKGEIVLVTHGTHWRKEGLTNGLFIASL